MSSPDRINPGDVGINKVNMDELQLIPTRPADESKDEVFSECGKRGSLFHHHISLHA
jgi:hypothetical protein